VNHPDGLPAISRYSATGSPAQIADLPLQLAIHGLHLREDPGFELRPAELSEESPDLRPLAFKVQARLDRVGAMLPTGAPAALETRRRPRSGAPTAMEPASTLPAACWRPAGASSVCRGSLSGGRFSVPRRSTSPSHTPTARRSSDAAASGSAVSEQILIAKKRQLVPPNLGDHVVLTIERTVAHGRAPPPPKSPRPSRSLVTL
jgi:hypothetical protein